MPSVAGGVYPAEGEWAAHHSRPMGLGGYADGRDWDLIRDEQVTDGEARAAVKHIGSLPIPARDPVTGEPMKLWRRAPRSYGFPF